MKKGIFWKIYWVLVLLFVLIIIGIWYVLYDFLAVYESAQPIHKMESVMTMFTENKVDQILRYTVADYSVQKSEDVKTYIHNLLEGKELTFAKSYGVDTDNFPVFSVRDENGEICKVYLKAKTQRGRYNSKEWELDRIENLVHRLEPIEIIAPEGYIVKVDGEVLDETFEVDTTEINELDNWSYIKAYSDYITFPSIVTYRVEELYLQPEITCTTPDGLTTVERMEGTAEYTYQYEGIYYEQIDEKIAEKVKNFAKKYVNYVTNDEEASEVLKYVLPNTPMYTRMQAIEKTNVWTPKHSAVEFSDMEILEYKTYGDRFFTCKLHFTYMIPYMMGNSEYDTMLHFYYVKDHGEWKIAEMFIE